MKTEILYDIIRFPVMTEKSTMIASQNKYVFKVAMNATKNQIKKAIEVIFNVKVKSINTIRINGKSKIFKRIRGVRNDSKKAIVTLLDNNVIDFSSGVV